MLETLDYNLLVAVAAILVAVLALWLRGWAGFAGERVRAQANRRIKVSSTLGTLWIYMALVIAFTSLGLLLAGKYWEGGWELAAEVGFGFFITAFLMALSNVFESTVTLLRRVFQGDTIYDDPRGIDPSKYGKSLLLQIIGIACGSLLFSTLGVVCQHWWWIGLAPVWAYGLCVYIWLTRR